MKYIPITPPRSASSRSSASLLFRGWSALVVGHRGAVADRVAAVVGELDHAHAHLGEQPHAIEFAAQHLRILEPIDHADLAGLAGGLDVRHAQHAAQRARMLFDERVPAGDVAHRGGERVGAARHVPQRDVDSRQPRAARVGERARVDGRRAADIAQPGGAVGIRRLRQVGIVQDAQGVDGRVAGLDHGILGALACRRPASGVRPFGRRGNTVE